MQESFQFSQVNFGFFRFKRRKKIFASCNCSSVSLRLPNFSYILLSIAKYSLRLVVSSKWLLKMPLVILNFQQYRHYFALIEENGIFSSNIPNHTNEKLKANKFSIAVIKNT